MWNSGLASIWVRDFDETKNVTMVVYFVVASPRHFKDCCHCVIKVLVYFQIGELAMISSKDAKEFLYKLFAERFIAMQVTWYESLVNTLSECPWSLSEWIYIFVTFLTFRRSHEHLTMHHPEHFICFQWNFHSSAECWLKSHTRY